MKKFLLLIILFCSACSAQDRYLFLARETFTPATRAEYFQKARALETRKKADCDCHRRQEFAVGYGSFLLSSPPSS